MENQRLFLWAAFGFIMFWIYQTWQTDYAPRPLPQPASEQISEATPANGESASEPIAGTSDDFPALPSDVEPQPQMKSADTAPVNIGAVVRVVTDVLNVDIATIGGDLVRADLSVYPVRKDDPDTPIRLLTTDPKSLYVIQTGVRSATPDVGEPNHRAQYIADANEYRLGDESDELVVELSWADGQLGAIKRYIFRRGSYSIDQEIEVFNRSAQVWSAAPYQQIMRRNVTRKRSMFDVDSFSFIGPVLYDGEKYEKLDYEDLEKEPISASYVNGWIANIQHHFLTAAIPVPDTPYTYTGQVRNGNIYMSAIGPVRQIAAGASHKFEQKLFVGPKLQQQLRETSPELDLTVDYGPLTILSQPLFWLLDKVHSFVGNWGWAIIFTTVLIKLLFYKLTQASGRSMAKMRKLQPRMKNLQERFKDDREALSKAMMELYKREKVNPVAGCLPMLIQIPVFLAYYWVLLESVEMRQAPFMLWITDLSSRDPFFVLPILMGISMYGQFKLNPAPPDPVQAKIFMFMPLVMTGMMAFFPAGLVLYWFTNTLLSIAQQWRINKVIEASSRD